jgi:uncharacterized protein (DUF1778 family)
MGQTALKSRNRKTPRPNAYRFDARLNEEQKVLIQKAADLQGRSMTDFCSAKRREGGRTDH